MDEKSNTIKGVVAFWTAVISVILLIALIWFAYQGYRYFNPPIEIHIWAREGEDLYWETPNYVTEGESVFGIAPEVKAAMTKWSDAITEADEWLHTYTKPIDVTCEVEISGEKTIITYEGYATTADGITEDVYNQFVLDFVITEDIIDHSVQ